MLNARRFEKALLLNYVKQASEIPRPVSRERLRSLQFDPRLSNTQHYSFAPDILIREKETVA